MLGFLRSRDGLCLTVGWLFAWLMLEMVFYGEPVFCYGSVEVGFRLYLAVLLAVVVCSFVMAAAFSRRGVGRRQSSASIPLLFGAVGSICLLVVRLAMGGVLPFWIAVACAGGFAVITTLLLAQFARATLAPVHERGLREVLGAALVGAALSFLLLPRFLRDGPYGLVLVVASPLVIAGALRLLPTTPPVPQGGADTGADAPVIASLTALGVLSFLTYLLAYFDFISAGLKVVVEENTYFYLGIFVLIGALLAVLALSPSERAFTERVFLYVLAGIVLLTLLVLFGLLNYLYGGGDYVYALTKFLRRAVKIAALFMTVVLIYQSGLAAAPAFLLVVVVPLVLAKVVQMAVASLPTLNALLKGSQFLYLSAIGFSAVAAWVLFLVFYVRGTVVGYSRRAEEESRVAVGAAERPLASFVSAHLLTEREADVLEYLAAGYSVRAISSVLCVSENTVKTHVASIYRKTGAHSRQEIIDLAAVR